MASMGPDTFRVFSSLDAGVSWNAGATVLSANNSPGLFAIGSYVYISLKDTVYKTSDGSNLTLLGSSGYPAGYSVEVLSGDVSYLYAGFKNSTGFYRYDIAGNNWTQMSSGLPVFYYSSGPFLVGSILYVGV